jgi:enamine deaminase RidA (YjgF/YER057c/UK114 family)
MEARIARNLATLGKVLPAAVPAAWKYEPVVVHGGLAYVSGQIPRIGEQILYADGGKVGAEVSLATAQHAAELCVLQGLAQLHAHLGGSLDRVTRVVKVSGFVASAAGFTAQPVVIDAASQLLLDLLGPDAGKHARAAVGVAELPRGVPVEVEFIFAVSE